MMIITYNNNENNKNNRKRRTRTRWTQTTTTAATTTTTTKTNKNNKNSRKKKKNTNKNNKNTNIKHIHTFIYQFSVAYRPSAPASGSLFKYLNTKVKWYYSNQVGLYFFIYMAWMWRIKCISIMLSCLSTFDRYYVTL